MFLNKGAVYGAVVVVLNTAFKVPLWQIALLFLTKFVAMDGGSNWLHILFKTFKRDMTGLMRYVKVLRRMRYCQNNNMTVPKVWMENVRKHPHKVCLVMDDKEWTYQDIENLSNQIARAFMDEGYRPGDVISLYLDNRPEYVAFWLGLAKVGIVSALINYNLKGKALLHCINVAESKALIYGKDQADAVNEICAELNNNKLYGFELPVRPSAVRNLDVLIPAASTTELDLEGAANYEDKMVYIYTSGTTGLPKAAVIRHSRYLFTSVAGYHAVALRPDDVVYGSLPLYHTAGGIMGAGMIFSGLKVVLRKKFSANNFWTDCVKYHCTAAQYIGETCRYLLAAQPKPEEQQHKVRIMFGNGLRPHIWEQFMKRFGIAQVAEFYGATEGNANIINMDGKVGAVGFVSRIAPWVYPVGLIKVDEETGEVIRGEDGLCISCKPDEPGMFVGKIVKNHPVRDFHGYADPTATSKKVCLDVFRKGDAAFLSGDILVMDELGYLFFKDRTGDTFRWRGENVSTTEVESIVSNVAGLKDAVVFGVEVHGAEGKAGMAVILDADKALDMESLATGLAKELPVYARPLFIRTVSEMDMTGTYKLRKVDFQKEGYDPNKIKDKLFFMDPKTAKYIPLTSELYAKIENGDLRL